MPARKNNLTPAEQAKLKEAGAELRKLREERRLTGPEIEQRTNHAIGKQQVSQIELGKIDRPSMFLLVTLGKLYNKTPGEMARIYGYWNEPEPSADRRAHPVLQKIGAIAQNLSPEHRNRWLSVVEVDAIAMLSEMRYDDSLDNNS